MATAVKKVTKMDKATADRIAEELLVAVQGFATARGLEARDGGGKYGEDDFTMRVKFTVTGARRREYLAKAKTYGLKPEWFDQTFVYKGRDYKIVGFDDRTRFSVQTEQVGNGAYSGFTVDMIKEAMGAKK